MAPAGLDKLSNPLATPAQLSNSSSSLDGVPADLEASVRFAGAQLTQTAGRLLHLPQDVIAQAIVIFSRFWIGPEGGSMAVYSAKHISAASLYLMAKLSMAPVSPRSLVNVYTYLLSPTVSPLPFVNPSGPPQDKPAPETYTDSDGASHTKRWEIFKHEALILRLLGFNTHVVVPHAIALTYLTTLGISSAELAQRVFEHLNSALLSPQILYLAHQPNALAVAAIYLSARDLGLKVVDGEWWEVFDVDREELGFLVVGLLSMEGFVRNEREVWKGKTVPLTGEEVEIEAEKRRMLESGE